MKLFNRPLTPLFHGPLTPGVASKAQGLDEAVVAEISILLVEQAREEVGTPGQWPPAKRDRHHILNEGRSLILRDANQRDTPLRERYRAIQAIVDFVCTLGYGTVPGKITVAALPPGAHIKRHYDKGEYYKYHNRLHVPLATNALVTTTIEQHEFHMSVGHVYLFQNLKYHSVRNASSEHRLHLIVDLLDPRYDPAWYRRLRWLLLVNVLWIGSLYQRFRRVRHTAAASCCCVSRQARVARAAGDARPQILHVTFNYPDELSPNNTVAVKRLIECASSFSDGFCVSLHDTFPHARFLRGYPSYAVVGCPALPLHFALRSFLSRCIELTTEAAAPVSRFTLIHAHRLTLEGYIARELQRRFAIPYCLSVRASDLEILRWKPLLRATFLDVLERANRIALLAPWMRAALARVFAHRWSDELENKLLLLGNVVDGPLRFFNDSNGRYACVFKVNRSQLRRKNVMRLLQAMQRLHRRGATPSLDIIGTGSGMPDVAEQIDRLHLTPHVRLIGHVPRERMIDTLSAYKGLLLCSYPETFGLAYLEALRAGIPVLYARGSGIDGLFKDYAIGQSADPRSTSSIADALLAMESRHAEHKKGVRELQTHGLLDDYTPPRYAARLQQDLYAGAH